MHRLFIHQASTGNEIDGTPVSMMIPFSTQDYTVSFRKPHSHRLLSGTLRSPAPFYGILDLITRWNVDGVLSGPSWCQIATYISVGHALSPEA